MESKSIEINQRIEEDDPAEGQDCHSMIISNDLYSKHDVKLARERILEFWSDMGQLPS